MDDVQVCRICLATNVKMFYINNYPLGTYFSPLILAYPLNSAELPPFACYECALLVKKYYFFRQKCLRGQGILHNILTNQGKITFQDINKIDRRNLNLISNLSTYFACEVDTFSIKHEPSDDAHVIECDYIKQEDDDFLGHASSDDEPLSLHKSIKDTEEKKDEKPDDMLEIDIDQDVRESKELTNTQTDLQLPSQSSKTKKKRRGRPRKNVEKLSTKSVRRTKNTGGYLLEEVALEEYVTVITPTIEEQKEEIVKRQQSSNYRNATYKCNLCFKGFIDDNAWNHHLKKHDPSAGDVICPICKFRFKSKRTLQKHAANHEKRYACRLCSYVSKTTTQAKQHQRWHDGVTYKCEHCSEVLTKWTSYMSHVRIKHPSEFICGVCGYSFISKLGLAMHKTMMHKDVVEKQETEGTSDSGPYCAECDVKFVSEEAWKRHMVTSVIHTRTTDINHGCRMCGEMFPTAEQLRVHSRREHSRQRPKNYGKKPSPLTWPANCDHCSEVIQSARDMWTHFRRVHPDKKYPIQKNYVCDVCGKSFRGNAFLVYHKRTHSEERSFKCAVCPKAFHNRTNLHMHEKTHSDVRPYPCSACFKAFKCKGALDRHFRSHTGIKPYECEVCGKAFGQSNSRKLHVRTVHLKQPAPYVSRSRLERRTKITQKDTCPPPVQQFIYQ